MILIIDSDIITFVLSVMKKEHVNRVLKSSLTSELEDDEKSKERVSVPALIFRETFSTLPQNNSWLFRPHFI